MPRMTNYQIAIAVLAMLVTAVTTPAHAQTFSVLYDFGSRVGDAANVGPVAQGEDGSLYGTSGNGGTGPEGGGTVFKITPDGKERVLHSFCFQANCSDGLFPSSLTLRPDGHFVGTASTFISPGAYGGLIFDVSQTGTFTTLYGFTESETGGYPQTAPPIEGADGSFYGVTYEGGTRDCGLIYRITTAGFTLLHNFDGPHGCGPMAPLVLGTDGNLYGATFVGGGPDNAGVAFRFELRPGQAPVLTVLADFDETSGGIFSPLIQGRDGNFYGTTPRGSTGIDDGDGAVFEMTPSGTLTTLYTLNGTTDGGGPSSLVQATDGNFYGVAAYGGKSPNCPRNFRPGCGTLFRITPAGSYSVLYNFDSTTGFSPGTLVQHTNGLLYGSTAGGGTGISCPDGEENCGVFYSWDGNLPPFVRTVQSMGPVGSSVEILGQGFNSSTTIAFNGKHAEVNLQSGTSLCSKVPAGATTGFVTVTTSSGTLTSNKKFIVTP